MPADVRVEDYGIRGLHLALDLLDGCDLLVLVDALASDDPPGTVCVARTGPDAAPAPSRSTPTGWTRSRCCSMVADLGRRHRAGARRRLPARRPRRGHRALRRRSRPPSSPPSAMVEDLIAERNAPCSVA